MCWLGMGRPSSSTTWMTSACGSSVPTAPCYFWPLTMRTAAGASGSSGSVPPSPPQPMPETSPAQSNAPAQESGPRSVLARSTNACPPALRGRAKELCMIRREWKGRAEGAGTGSGALDSNRERSQFSPEEEMTVATKSPRFRRGLSFLASQQLTAAYSSSQPPINGLLSLSAAGSGRQICVP